MMRKLIIKFITPYVWRFNKSAKSKALLEFATIEKDSGNQILWALELIPDPTTKALIFQHILEEYFHADLFEGLSNKFSDFYLNKEVLEREIMVDKNSSPAAIREFFAYAHVGEDGVNSDFEYYGKIKNIDAVISSVFKKVSEDENQHIFGTSDILLKLVNNNKSMYYSLIVKSKFKRIKKHWKRYISHVGSVLLYLSLALVYFFIGIFSYKNIRARFLSFTSSDIVNLINDEQKAISKI